MYGIKIFMAPEGAAGGTALAGEGNTGTASTGQQGAPASASDGSQAAQSSTGQAAGAAGQGAQAAGAAGTQNSNGQAGAQGAEAKAVEAAADFSIKVPEGVNLDKSMIDSFTAFAKENKVSSDNAQKFFDQFLATQQKAGEAAQKAAVEAHMEQVTKWAEEAKSDPEIGGAKFDANLAAGKKALQRFGNPGLSKMLNETGLGNHKDVISFFAKVGKLISEDKLPGGLAGQGGGDPVNPAAVLYPSMQQK